MAKKSAGRLAGLAALGAAAYLIDEKLSKGKGKSDDAGDQITSNYTKKDKKVESDETQLKSREQSIKDADKSVGSSPSPNSQQASGVLTSAASAPVQQQTVKAEDLPRAAEPAKNNKNDKNENEDKSVKAANKNDRNEDYSNEGRYKPEIKTENKSVKAANKIQKSQDDRRNMEATTSRGMPAADKSIPSASSLKYQAPSAKEVASSKDRKKNYGMFDAIKDYYASPSSKEGVMRNLSNTAAALTPMTGGASKVATEFAMGRNAAKASQGEGKLSAAGQRLKNMEEVRNVAMPGRKEAVTNPMAWAGGPKMMEKVSAQEAQVVRAAQAAAKKKAAQDKRDAKDPLMNARPGADKAKPASKTSKAKPKSKYETDEAMDISFGYKKGGSVKKFAKGGSVSSASSRADGCAIRGKTKGMISKMKSGGMYGGKGAC